MSNSNTPVTIDVFKTIQRSHNPLFPLGNRVTVKDNVPEDQKEHVGKTGYVQCAFAPNDSEKPGIVFVGLFGHPANPKSAGYRLCGDMQIFEFDASCLDTDNWSRYNQRELARKLLLQVGEEVTVRNVNGMLNNDPDLIGVKGKITHVPQDIYHPYSIQVEGEKDPKLVSALFLYSDKTVLVEELVEQDS